LECSPTSTFEWKRLEKTHIESLPYHSNTFDITCLPESIYKLDIFVVDESCTTKLFLPDLRNLKELQLNDVTIENTSWVYTLASVEMFGLSNADCRFDWERFFTSEKNLKKDSFCEIKLENVELSHAKSLTCLKIRSSQVLLSSLRGRLEVLQLCHVELIGTNQDIKYLNLKELELERLKTLNGCYHNVPISPNLL
jgi:hypothetical protein